jgi:hypothetical protein
MTLLHSAVADAVAQAAGPLLLPGDCPTALGAVAGLRRRYRDVAVVFRFAVFVARVLCHEALTACPGTAAVVAGPAVASWTRPKGMRARSAPKRWSPEEDAVVMQMTQKDAAERLGRTVRSVNMRSWRLRQIVNVIGCGSSGGTA